MKVFISWSGDRSRRAAEELKAWLQRVIQSVDPWVSPDIAKGARWGEEVARELEAAKVGIFCLTAENKEAPWLLFEAGAVSKTKDAHVCTLLIGVAPSEVSYPLAQFQHTLAEESQMFGLLQTINAAVERTGGRALAEAVLRESFDAWWPKLELAFCEIARQEGHGARPRQRSERELLEEVVELVRGQERRLALIEEKLLNESKSSALPDEQTQSNLGRLVLSLKHAHSHLKAEMREDLRGFIEEQPDVVARLLSADPRTDEDIAALLMHMKAYRVTPRAMTGWLSDLGVLWADRANRA